MKCRYCDSELIDESDDYKKVWKLFCKLCDIYYDGAPRYYDTRIKRGEVVRRYRNRSDNGPGIIFDKPAPYCLTKLPQSIHVTEEFHDEFLRMKNDLARRDDL